MALSQTGKAVVGGALIAGVVGGGYLAYKKGLFSPHAVEYSGPHANGSGATVTLVAPQQVTQGQNITVTATSSGLTNPLYNFFFGIPGATGSPNAASSAAMSGWTSTGYQPMDTASVPATTTGAWSEIVYARDANAPANELAQGQAFQFKYEADSGGFTTNVVP